ncbi:hypothetical protein GALL_527900 [mine drainage metagenome]|uniref:Uncharacterized protein n=1 Tax=mine drainage metagenome TaxID=410659 RepID=A0A1J5P3I1_9ZZZZ
MVGEIAGGAMTEGLPPSWLAAGGKDAGKKFGPTAFSVVSGKPSPKETCGSVVNFDLIA